MLALVGVLGLAIRAPLAAQTAGGSPDLTSLIPDGMFQLSDVAVFQGSGGGVTAVATTTLMGDTATVLASMGPGTGGARRLIFALAPSDWSLSRAFPSLSNPVLDALPFAHVGLVVSSQNVDIPAAELSDDEWDFWHQIYQSDDFALRLTPGLNLIAAIPSEQLPADHPLRRVMDALGIAQGSILLQGTLGSSLGLLRGGATAEALRDMYLRAELPPMHPPGSPKWFRSGQLALEITGQPSIRLVGEMNVTIDDADLQFFLAAMLARSGLSLSGGMEAAQPWVAPFGISWLTLKRVVLEIGITPTGSVDLGFGGAAVIGRKDIDVAVSIALSPAGVPDNFMMQGQSDSGVGLSDLVQLQAGMAAARPAAAGATGLGSGATTIPIGALPDVEIKSLGLKFAPKADPVLGIERGFRIAGRLWLPTGPGGTLQNFAGVDANVGDSGIWVRGDMNAWSLGPLAFDDAKLDLTATHQDQHLIVHGRVQLGTSSDQLDLAITRDSLHFHTETELFGLFHAMLDARAGFQLRNPTFTVDGVVSNDFGTYFQPILRDGVLRFASTGQAVVAGAERAADAMRRALAVEDATVAQLRSALERQRANAQAAWTAAGRRAASALAAADAAARARDAARSLWAGTPRRRPALRAARYADYLRLAAAYGVAAGRYVAAQSAANALKSILDAIPPVDRNVLLLAADAATAALRARLEEAERNLDALATHLDQVVSAVRSGADPLAIQYAAFHANLAVVQGGGSMSWTVRGTFVGQPFDLHQQLDFGSPAQAAADLLTGLLRG
jgi:hypothetical protein